MTEKSYELASITVEWFEALRMKIYKNLDLLSRIAKNLAKNGSKRKWSKEMKYL